MRFAHYNPNPCGRTVGDCSVRAISKALNMDWGEAFSLLSSFAYSMCDMANDDMISELRGMMETAPEGAKSKIRNLISDLERM